MSKAPTPKENSKKQRDNIKNAIKYFDYTIFTFHTLFSFLMQRKTALLL